MYTLLLMVLMCALSSDFRRCHLSSSSGVILKAHAVHCVVSDVEQQHSRAGKGLAIRSEFLEGEPTATSQAQVQSHVCSLAHVRTDVAVQELWTVLNMRYSTLFQRLSPPPPQLSTRFPISHHRWPGAWNPTWLVIGCVCMCRDVVVEITG